MGNSVLVVSGHVGDFVWRSGGTMAKFARHGYEVHLRVLTLGLRGESNGYWKQDDATMEKGRALRREEGRRAADILGVTSLELWDYDDYPLLLGRERLERLAVAIRETRPAIILTHDSQRDLFNADHTLIGKRIHEAVAMAISPTLELNDLPPAPRPAIWGFEPHIAELCGFQPQTYVDITDVMNLKREAMQVYQQTQKGMIAPYITKNRLRAIQTARPGCEFAEAFSIADPVQNPGFLAP